MSKFFLSPYVSVYFSTSASVSEICALHFIQETFCLTCSSISNLISLYFIRLVREFFNVLNIKDDPLETSFCIAHIITLQSISLIRNSRNIYIAVNKYIV